MSFGGKTNPKSLRGGISGTNMPEWMTYVGLQYSPNKVTFATGQPTASPRGALYIGNNIEVSGASDGNIVLSLGNSPSAGTLNALKTTLSGKTDVISLSGTLPGNVTPGTQSIGIGGQSNAVGQASISIGYQTSTSGTAGIAIGNTTTTASLGGTNVGSSSTATNGTSFGYSNTTGNNISVGSSITHGGAGGVVATNGTALNTGTGYGNVVLGAGNAGMSTNNNAYINVIGTNSAWNAPGAGVHGSTIIGSYGTIDQSGSLTISAGAFSGANEAATAILTGRMRTTDATPTEIGFPGTQAECQTSLAPTGRIILNNSSSYIFDCNIVARKSTAGTDYAMWNLKFGITREANAASTALVGTPISTLLGATAGAATWAVAVTADTTNGRPLIALTGAATTTIRWVMTAHVTKVVG